MTAEVCTPGMLSVVEASYSVSNNCHHDELSSTWELQSCFPLGWLLIGQVEMHESCQLCLGGLHEDAL